MQAYRQRFYLFFVSVFLFFPLLFLLLLWAIFSSLFMHTGGDVWDGSHCSESRKAHLMEGLVEAGLHHRGVHNGRDME
jgi:hypothetical protein